MNLPAQWEQSEVLPYSPSFLTINRCNTPGEILERDFPTLAKISRDHTDYALVKGIAYLLKRLYDVRFSKTEFSPTLLDEFYEWVKIDYYFLTLQDLELAFMNYREKSFHVIDLEILKDMVEVYDMERAKAVRQKEKSPGAPIFTIGLTKDGDLILVNREGDQVPGVLPEETQALLKKLAVQRKLKRDSPEKPRPKNLLELLETQGFKDPKETEGKILEEWRQEWDLLKEGEAISGVKSVPDWELFRMKKESYFITQAIRPRVTLKTSNFFKNHNRKR